MEKKKVAFCTLGCKVNQYETNAMEQKMLDKGYQIVGFHKIADIYVINTCTVTNMADRKSRQMLRKVKELNSNAMVVACGCYAQVAKEELEKIPEIDLILGVNEKNQIVEYIEEYLKNQKESFVVTDVMQQQEYLDFGATTYAEKTRAVIKIQDGCNMFCSYCIIPYARGRVRSRKIESIIEEAKQIAKTGRKELVITGIHIASYGKDLQEDISLIDVLEALEKVEGIERIRLGSLEPTIITEEFLERLKKLRKICDHFHLSLQSGCDSTLKRMNRKYTTEQFKNSVTLLRKYYPEISLTTDIIVGFPGETEEEFERTYQFLKAIYFYQMHIFKYSPRKGTRAAEMENQISADKKEERSHKLIQLSKKLQENHQQKYKDRLVEVLWEEKNDGYWKGHTKNYMTVKLKADDKNLENKLSIVKVDRIEEKTIEMIAKEECSNGK